MTVETVRPIQPPRGCRRFLFRLPLVLYRLGLGWILGHRFLQLVHRGRQSGAEHRTVLEVVKRGPESRVHYVVSAWGERSDWLRNLRADPNVDVVVGRERFSAQASLLPQEQAERIFLEYGRLHPLLLKELAAVVGYRIQMDELSFRQLARVMCVVRLAPRRLDGNSISHADRDGDLPSKGGAELRRGKEEPWI